MKVIDKIDNKKVKQKERNSDELKFEYDAISKKILSNKWILAWILKSVVEEFVRESIDEIREYYIEGIPSISKKIVNPNENRKEIRGINGENIIVDEGVRTFDIVFTAVSPIDYKEVIVDVEPQNEYHPGYVLDTRMVYYGSRLISSQYGREFANSNYNDIKKVYSIWICTNPPKSEFNTISKYSVERQDVLGKQKDRSYAYDKMVLIKICLGGKQYDNYVGIVKLLHILLVSKINVKEKISILENEFGIYITKKLEKEVSEMCDLAEGLWKEALAEGIEKGTDLFASLTQKLINDSRTQELLIATTDSDVREKLYKEYAIK